MWLSLCNLRGQPGTVQYQLGRCATVKKDLQSRFAVVKKGPVKSGLGREERRCSRLPVDSLGKAGKVAVLAWEQGACTCQQTFVGPLDNSDQLVATGVMLHT